MYKIRSPEDYNKFRMALIPVDQAFFASETKWGVGRLERLVSNNTLNSYHRGWLVYRTALEAADGEALETIGPKMIAALQYMDAEATAAGHAPLAPDTWEHAMADGTVLVVVRSSAEASAVIRAERNVTAATGRPRLGMTLVTEASPPEPPSTETALPPDLAVTVRQQHEGRRLEVWTLAEMARLVQLHGELVEHKDAGKKWQGDATYSGRQMEEGAAADLIRQGHPLDEPIGADVRPAAKMELAF